MSESPDLRVVKGSPTEEELAAVTVVLLGLAAAQAKRKDAPELTYGGGWKSYWRTVRSPIHSQRDSWRGSLRG